MATVEAATTIASQTVAQVPMEAHKKFLYIVRVANLVGHISGDTIHYRLLTDFSTQLRKDRIAFGS